MGGMPSNGPAAVVTAATRPPSVAERDQRTGGVVGSVCGRRNGRAVLQLPGEHVPPLHCTPLLSRLCLMAPVTGDVCYQMLHHPFAFLQVFQFMPGQTGSPGYVGPLVTPKTQVTATAAARPTPSPTPLPCWSGSPPICRPPPVPPSAAAAAPCAAAQLFAEPGPAAGVCHQPEPGLGSLLLHACLRHQRRRAGGLQVCGV